MLGITHAMTCFMIGRPGPDIEWTAPAECPSAAELRRRVHNSLADAPNAPPQALDATISRVDGRILRLEIVLHDASVGRYARPPIDSEDCAELADNFVNYADMTWRARATSPGSGRARGRVAARLRFAGRAGHGILPGAAFGGGQIVFGLAWRYARVEIGAAADGATDAQLPGLSATTWVRGGGLLRGCGVVPVGSLELHLCGEVEGGGVKGKGQRWHHVTPTIEVHAAPALLWWFHRAVGLWVGVSGGPLLMPLRPTSENTGATFKTTSYFVAGGVGFEFCWDG